MTGENSPALLFDRGTIILQGFSDGVISRLESWVKYDQRTKNWRAEARSYREIATLLRELKVTFNDHARAYSLLRLELKAPLVPRTHQSAAIAAWKSAGYRGVVSLPTGAGKTVLAVMCMSALGRPTLICVPTIDLMQQWRGVLEKFFDIEIGMLGGGSQEIKEVTVATYDSAAIHAERLGPRFGLDHRLPIERKAEA